MTNYTLIYNDNDEYIYFLIKQNKFISVKKQYKSKNRPLFLGLLLILIAASNAVSKKSIFSYMDIKGLLVMVLTTIMLGISISILYSKKVEKDLLSGSAIHLKVKDLKSQSEKIERTWKAELTLFWLVLIIGISGLVLSFMKNNFVYAFCACSCLFFAIFSIMTTHFLYKRKLMKLIRNKCSYECSRYNN